MKDQREKHEAAIAIATADRILQHLDDADIGQPEVIAHHFGMACRDIGYGPEDEASAQRIMVMVSREIAVKREIAERIAAAVRVPDYLRA